MSIFKHASAALVLSLVALTGTAAAQDYDPPPEPEPMPDPTTTTTTETETETTTTVTPEPAPIYEPQPVYQADVDETPGDTLERYGIAVALGGGVEGFASETLRDATDPGGQWNVRVAIGTRSPLAFEAAYIGSAQSIDALGLDNDAILVGNGVEGKVRVNLLDEEIQPFAFAGIGWRRYSLTNEDFNTSAVSSDDDVLELPFGVGVAYKYRGFLLDARGEMRLATEEDLMPSRNSADPADMHRWGVNANIGYAF
jgi:hypothetical protein